MTTQLDRSYKPAPAHAGGVAFLRIQSPFHGQADKRDLLEPISRAIDSHLSKHHARVSLIGYACEQLKTGVARQRTGDLREEATAHSFARSSRLLQDSTEL